MVVEAGCILQAVQQAARDADRLFPLSLAAEGSCTLGGNLATNAGGTQVLRYGNARDLVLGLEVVTADGDIWHGLRGLRKDNTGRSEEHTSELQSLMRLSYAVFCLKTKNTNIARRKRKIRRLR